ncbi:MW1434 family type I TA system toxin [Staphylococcus warneri]|uniref:Thoeris anti-defense Tad2 family protein n=1 Tax=Staphylococcus warneri TaxID=1292 RepID=UPI003CE86F6B
MNIQEATKLAMENGKSIYRSSEFEIFRKPGDNLELLPTNSYGYVVVKPRQKAFYPLWQPMAEDLLADDWEVVGSKIVEQTT